LLFGREKYAILYGKLKLFCKGVLMLDYFNTRSLLSAGLIALASSSAYAQEVGSVTCSEAEIAYLVFDEANLRAIAIPEDLRPSVVALIPEMEKEARKTSPEFTSSAYFVYKDIVSGNLYAAIQGHPKGPDVINVKPTIGCYTPISSSATSPSP